MLLSSGRSAATYVKRSRVHRPAPLIIYTGFYISLHQIPHTFAVCIAGDCGGRRAWRMTEAESGGSDWPIGGAVAVRVSDERSEKLVRQDGSRRFPVSRDRPTVPQSPAMSRAMPVSSGVVYHEKMGEVVQYSADLARFDIYNILNIKLLCLNMWARPKPFRSTSPARVLF